MTPEHIDPRKASYWEKVLILQVTDNTEYIAYILSTETEDDFRAAILDNPLATTEQVAWAGECPSRYVREKVLNHPDVPASTVQAILSDAREAVAENEVQARTVSSMQHHYQWLVDTNTKLVTLAEEVLSDRAKKEQVQ